MVSRWCPGLWWTGTPPRHPVHQSRGEAISEIYFQDDHVTLYHGDMATVISRVGEVDAIVTDPPYGATDLAWDRWPKGWTTLAAEKAASMWVFGTMRMFLTRWEDIVSPGWKLSHDVVWTKNMGSSFHNDRFRRHHEHALHFYRGTWRDVYHDVPRIPGSGQPSRTIRRGPKHPGHHGATPKWSDYDMSRDRLMTSILPGKVVRRGSHPTSKPVEVLRPLVEYAVPPGGVVLDPFGGGGSTAVAAKQTGRRCVLIEANEEYCEAAATRLATLVP